MRVERNNPRKKKSFYHQKNINYLILSFALLFFSFGLIIIYLLFSSRYSFRIKRISKYYIYNSLSFLFLSCLSLQTFLFSLMFPFLSYIYSFPIYYSSFFMKSVKKNLIIHFLTMFYANFKQP